MTTQNINYTRNPRYKKRNETNKTESYWPAYVGMKNTDANLRARANFKKGEKPSYIRA